MKMLCYVMGICLFLTRIARAEEPTGIKFFTGSWKAVLAEAKRQDKPVFVDIYTTWCGPCKLMAKQAFPDAKVGEKFNANFINYQIDAEKGEGIEIAKKYAVAAYPTSLYVAANGNLIYRAIGYGGIPGMLSEADNAITATKDPNSLSSLEKQYADGNRDAGFVATYLAKRGQVGMPNGKALDAYLKTVPEGEWSSDKNVELITGNLTGDNAKAVDILMRKLKEVRSVTDKQSLALRDRISGKIGQLISMRFKQAIANKDEQLLEMVIKSNEDYLTAARTVKLDKKQATDLANGYRTSFYLQTKNIDKYRPLALAEGNRLMAMSIDSVKAKNEVAYKQFLTQTANTPDSVKNRDDFKRYAESMKTGETMQMGNLLNNLAWSYHENIPDIDINDLNQALVWSAKSLNYHRNAAGLDTYAHLLSKLGRKEEAIKTEEEAIIKAKATGGNTANYEKELIAMKAR